MADRKHNPSYREQDDQLRSVPVPEGLLRRLKEGAIADDAGLDAAVARLPESTGLRRRIRAIPLAEDRPVDEATGASPLLDDAICGVPLPGGLIQRLKSIPLSTDQGIDESVRRIPVEAIPSERLRAIPMMEDSGIDAALRNVAVPTAFIHSLRAIPHEAPATAPIAPPVVRTSAARPPVAAPPVVPPLVASGETLPTVSAASREARETVYRRRARRLLIVRWTTAVGILAMLTSFYYGGLGNWIADRIVESDVELAAVVVDEPDDAMLGPEVEPTKVARAPEGTALPLESPEPVVSAPSEPITPPAGVPESAALAGDGPLGAATVSDSPGESDVDREVWSTLQFAPIPEMEETPRLRPLGIEPPLVPGYDFGFQARYNLHPAVLLTRDSRLETSQFPLLSDTIAYEEFREELAQGRRPAPETVRTEAFLAAIDCGLPAPTDRPLELSTALGPGPLDPQSTFMQVGVQARMPIDRPREPIALTVAIDISQSMGRYARFAKARRALETVFEQMHASDELTVVVFGESAQVVAYKLGTYQFDRLHESLAAIEPSGPTYVREGIRLALDATAGKIAAEPADEPAIAQPRQPLRQRVVLITDGREAVHDALLEQLRTWLNDAKAQSIGLDVIDVNGFPALDPETQKNDQLSQLAQAGGGRVYRAGLTWRMVTALREIISGHDALVAQDVEVEVVFNSKVVVAYRLLGHEGGALTRSPNAAFTEGQSAQGFYQIKLTDKGKPSDVVATIDLSWRQPGDENARAVRHILRRKDLAPSLLEAPLAFQHASLVAQTAEILRESFFVRGRIGAAGLRQILQAAEGVDTRLYERRSFTEFMTMVERAAEAKPPRRG